MTPKRQSTPSTALSGRPIADALDPQLGGSPASGVHHLLSDVRGEQQPGRPEVACRDEARVSGAGRELEHGLTRNGCEQRDEPLVEMAGRIARTRRLTFPACGGRTPRLHLLMLGCGYVATFVNCGMTSDP
jgi:hypothetical protein